MARIALVAGGKSKTPEPAPAGRLYTSPLFRLSLAYARQLDPDALYILSARHGAVTPDTRLAPYDGTLVDQPAPGRMAWAARVAGQLGADHDLLRDTFIVLAGTAYRIPLARHLDDIETPLAHLRIAQQLSWLSHHVNRARRNRDTGSFPDG